MSDSWLPYGLYVAHQAPLSMQFSRQEHWSRLPVPSSVDLPDPGIKVRSPVLQTDSLLPDPPGKPLLKYAIKLKLLTNKLLKYVQPYLCLSRICDLYLTTSCISPEFWEIFTKEIQFSSVHFSRSVVSDSLRRHESQHARPPCPSPTLGVHSDSRPLSP